MSLVEDASEELRKYALEEHAVVLRRFFKTGPGQYGEGDVFIGVKMPSVRKVAKIYAPMFGHQNAETMLRSTIHEERMLALVMLTLQYAQATDKTKRAIHQLYCNNREFVNNWDLVDISCPHLVGRYLLSRARTKLYRWADSASLWDRRIAIVSTLAFIREDDFSDCLGIAEILLQDDEDLLHKATGWMLREVGKRSREVLDGFLMQHSRTMPRTMLRYAIEKHSAKERSMYMA